MQRLVNQSRWGLGYDEEKLIAEFIVDNQSTRRTALEILRTFFKMEKIFERDGKIYVRTFFNDDLTFKEETIKVEEKLDKAEEELLTS